MRAPEGSHCGTSSTTARRLGRRQQVFSGLIPSKHGESHDFGKSLYVDSRRNSLLQLLGFIPRFEQHGNFSPANGLQQHPRKQAAVPPTPRHVEDAPSSPRGSARSARVAISLRAQALHLTNSLMVFKAEAAGGNVACAKLQR